MGLARSYPTKVDAWILLLVAAPLVSGLLVGCLLLFQDTTLGLGICGFMLLICLSLSPLAVPCTYTLTEDTLIVRSGLIRRRIPYQRIVSIEPSMDPRSAPAWSLQRVKIRLKGGGVLLVSPNERDDFIERLRELVELQRRASARRASRSM